MTHRGILSIASVARLAVLLLLTARMPAVGPDGLPNLRFGYSRQLVSEVNESDARAAMRMNAVTWTTAAQLTLDQDLPALDSAAEINRALRDNRVDILAVGVAEYLALDPTLIRAPLLVATRQGEVLDEYVLVVKNDSGPRDIAALRGRTIAMLDSHRSPLARVWLDVLLLRAGLGTADQCAGNIRIVHKASQAALPVFFGQADAAVLPQDAFKVMCDMNPQLGRELRILAISPGYVASVSCMRAGLTPALVDRILRAIADIPQSNSGRQMLTIFQVDMIVTQPVSCTDSARELLAEHERLLAVEPRGHDLAKTPAAPEGTP